MMERQVVQMVRLIDDLLDVSRISQRKIQLRREPVELAGILQQAVETSPAHRATGHRLTITLPEQPLWLNADPLRLGQVFTNLLNNAAKFTPPGGEIWLTAEQAGTEAIVRVRDTGVGIPAEKVGSVFEMFVQVDNSLERTQSGLGLGLTLVRSLVTMHGGTVEVHSDGPGQGSVFVVRLPVAEVSPRPAAVEAPAVEFRTSRLRILVVDDNADSAESLALLLSILGHESCLANDGFSALERIAVFRPRVIVCDLGMPGISGLEVARRVRREHGRADIFLIALTGYGAETDRQSCEEAGFDAHLIKPIEIDTLQQLLARVAEETTNGGR